MSSDAEVIVVSDPEDLAQEAASRFSVGAAQAQSSSPTAMFRVALSGGSTPRTMYEKLAAAPYRDRVDWSRTQVVFSDERFVPPDAAESNFHTAQEALLSRVNIPDRFIHRYATVETTPQESAVNYEQGIRRVFGVGLDEVPRFDLIMLGLGPDGHTASLFPRTEALHNTHDLVVANFVPKIDMWRLTFTYRLINAGRTVMFLVQGTDKAERVREVMHRDPSLPASGVRPSPGRLVWLLDQAAAGRLHDEGRTPSAGSGPGTAP
jgi:6-phosphogluconolactonase